MRRSPEDGGRRFRALRPFRGAGLGLALLLAPGPGAADDPPRTLSVTGSGRVAAAPDAALLEAGATREASEAAAAIAANGEVMTRVLAALRDEGIAEKDIQTTQLRLAPYHPQGARGGPIAGYRATSRVRVRVRDLERAGPVLDALVGAGANELGGLSFVVLESEPLLDRARAAAVADARRKAQLLAREAGVGLGPVLEIRDGAAPGPIGRGGFRGEAMMAAQAVPVATGELEFNAQVSVVYALDPDDD